MIGAIIGDIVGSRFEFVEDGCRGKDFALFASGCRFTDDSLMTLAVAKSLLLPPLFFKAIVTSSTSFCDSPNQPT